MAPVDQLSVVSLAVAFAAGFVSFASPCVLALVPGYLSFISGVPADQVEQRWKGVLRPTAAFVLGFAVMFALFGASAGLIGRSLARDREVLNLVAGIILVVFGIAMVLLPRTGWLQSDRHVRLSRRPETLVGAGLVGAAFAAGWTPCIRSSAASSPMRPPRDRPPQAPSCCSCTPSGWASRSCSRGSS